MALLRIKIPPAISEKVVFRKLIFQFESREEIYNLSERSGEYNMLVSKDLKQIRVMDLNSEGIPIHNHEVENG